MNYDTKNQIGTGWVLLGLAAAALAPAGAHAARGDDAIGTGALRVLEVDGKPVDAVREFPLRHTSARIEVSGFVARTEVVQRFENPFRERIEAVYVFPLPAMAAVDEMELRVGDRTIRGLIKKRAEAIADYERAKSNGQTAALLEQERPNVFTQSVANIGPGERVEVVLRYVETLKYDDGRYELAFPTVVGPRYIPGAPLGGESSGGGWSVDTDTVPDASRITPPVLRPGERSGHDLDITVELDGGVPLTGVRSPSHAVVLNAEPGGTRARVTLEAADRIPNKDFVLRWGVAGDAPRSALLAHHDTRGGFFTLLVQPPREKAIDPEDVTPKELYFVVDTSGSMGGAPLGAVKRAMLRAITGLNPRDTFQILRFDESVSGLSPVALENTPANVERGRRYIENLEAGGGTDILSATRAALLAPREQRLRIVLFMTDGYVGNDDQVLSAIQGVLGNARLFSFGVGSSVNRHLLERMADVGRGVVEVVRPDEEVGAAVDRFYERIRRPLLTDVEVDFGGLDVHDVYPQRIPDLFDAQPLLVHGRYEKGGRATVVVRARGARGERVELPVRVDLSGGDRPEHAALPSVWARQRIGELTAQQYGGERAELVDAITATALEFHLMSPYTAFVAVEETVRFERGTPRTVTQPVPMPEGVDYDGVFGGLGAAGVKGKLAGHGMLGYGAGGGGMAAQAPAKMMGSTGYGAGRGAAATRERRFDGPAASPPPPMPTAPAVAVPALGRSNRYASGESAADALTDKDEASVARKGDGRRTTEPRDEKKPAGAPIRVDGLRVSGALSEAAVRRVLEDAVTSGAVRAALARGGAGTAGPQTVTVELVVGESGRVQRAEVRAWAVVGGTGPSDDARRELVRALRGLTFGAASGRGRTVVSVTLVLAG